MSALVASIASSPALPNSIKVQQLSTKDLIPTTMFLPIDSCHRENNMGPRSTPKGVIFDLGNVLFTWSSETSTNIPAKMIRNIVSSPIWMRYECGLIEQNTCYRQIAQQYSIQASVVAEAFSQVRDSLKSNNAMISFIHDLKAKSQGAVKIFAMSNVAKEDYAVFSSKIADWSIFNHIFTSGHAGMRKPNLDFYRHVLREVELSPEETLFIDDKMENVMAARSLGIDSILFDSNVTVVNTLRTILYDPLGVAFQYLHRHAQQFDSITDTGINVPDNFARLLILETMQDPYV